MPAGRGGQLKWPVTTQPVFSTHTEAGDRGLHPLGARGEDIFGRTYRYALAGGTALIAGDMQQGAAQLANHQARTPVAAAIDDKEITISLGSTAITVRDYAGGLAVIRTTPGLGYAYPIKAAPAGDSGASAYTVGLAEGWTIQVALTTSSRVSLFANPYSRVIQLPASTPTNVIVGVAMYPVTLSEYGWLGTHGAHAVLIQGTPAVGTAVGVGSTAGALGALAADVTAHVGDMMDTGEDGSVAAVFLRL